MTVGRYFTGKPCKRGHVAERYLSTRGCVECLTRAPREVPAEPVTTLTLRVHGDVELPRLVAFYTALVGA